MCPTIQVTYSKYGTETHRYFFGIISATLFCYIMTIFGYSGTLYDDEASAYKFEVKSW